MANTGPEDPTWSTTSRCSRSSPGRSTGSDSGGTTSPASPVLNQTRLLTFPGSIATTSIDAGSASCSKPTTNLPSTAETSSGRSRGNGVNGYQLAEGNPSTGRPANGLPTAVERMTGIEPAWPAWKAWESKNILAGQ